MLRGRRSLSTLGGLLFKCAAGLKLAPRGFPEEASMMRPRRSVLFTPGSNARAMEKARHLECDVIVLDLEDAVAPEAKGTARAAVCEAVAAKVFGAKEVAVRINGFDTPWRHD